MLFNFQSILPTDSGDEPKKSAVNLEVNLNVAKVEDASDPRRQE